jgi:hypothetical protein
MEPETIRTLFAALRDEKVEIALKLSGRDRGKLCTAEGSDAGTDPSPGGD